RASASGLAQFLLKFRQGGEEVGDEAVIGNLKDRRLFVLIDRDDDLRILHAGKMLDRAGNPDRDVKFWRDDLAGLPDLPIVRRVAGIDGGARSAHRRAELVRYRFDIFLEVLGVLHRAAAGNDDLRRGQLRPIILGEFFALEGRYAWIASRRDVFDR